MYYRRGDYSRVKQLLAMSKRELHTSKQAYQRQLEALDRMREYCEEGVRCRRNLLVEHFGERPERERLCREEGNVPCDNCERLNKRWAVCNKHDKNRWTRRDPPPPRPCRRCA